MVGNKFVNHSSISISDFVLINVFDVLVLPPSATIIKEVNWSFPSRGWLKRNYDDVFNSFTNARGCGGIFRNYRGDFLLAFTEKLSTGSSMFAEFSVVLSAIDLSKDHGCSKIWIKIDYIMVEP